MTGLASKQHYQKIASELEFPTQAFIDGKYYHSSSQQMMTSHNPASGQVIAEVVACTEEDLDKAVESAKTVFKKGDWSQISPEQRKKILYKFVELIGDNVEQLAVLESLESGKPIVDCIEVDLPETQRCIAWFAEAADKLYDSVAPSGQEAMGLIVKQPVGVVGCVLPWNYPLMMMAWKIGPALAAGNSVIVKPAEQTSVTALKLAELATQAGLPAGVLNVVPGVGEVVGKAMGCHSDIDVISFTGSTEVGKLFLQYSANSNLKEITLECGGKSPSIVMSDAKDLDKIAEHVVYGAFINMGQNCCANSRLIVHSTLKDRLLEKVVDKVLQWKMGDPLDPENKLGSLISAEHFDKVMGYIDQGKKEGAKLILGGNVVQPGNGFFVTPTIFDAVTPQMRIAKEEMFGPILCVMSVESDDEALRLANDTNYGLQASIFSSSLQTAMQKAKQIKAGTVSINAYAEGDISTPFGGFKTSGFGGKDNSLKAFDQYTETKTIWIDLS